MYFAAPDPTVIDWSHIKFYNTLMAFAAGGVIITLGFAMRNLTHHRDINPRGWAVALGIPGFIATITGLGMVLTWPLAPTYAADNISFGEPESIIGVLGLGLSFYFWRRADAIEAAEEKREVERMVARDLRYLSPMLIAAGAGLFMIGLAGPVWGLYVAPPQEPIVGLFATWGYEWVFSWFIFGVWAFTGMTAASVPLVLQRMSGPDEARVTKQGKIIINCVIAAGATFLFMAVCVWFTHIGMVLNTTEGGYVK